MTQQLNFTNFHQIIAHKIYHLCTRMKILAGFNTFSQGINVKNENVNNSKNFEDNHEIAANQT